MDVKYLANLFGAEFPFPDPDTEFGVAVVGEEETLQKQIDSETARALAETVDDLKKFRDRVNAEFEKAGLPLPAIEAVLLLKTEVGGKVMHAVNREHLEGVIERLCEKFPQEPIVQRWNMRRQPVQQARPQQAAPPRERKPGIFGV